MLTFLGPQSRFGDLSVKIRVVCPQNGTAALKVHFFFLMSENAVANLARIFSFGYVPPFDFFFFFGGGAGDDWDMLGKLGDHPHTNFRTLFEKLLDAGYYVEVLGSDW